MSLILAWKSGYKSCLKIVTKNKFSLEFDNQSKALKRERERDDSLGVKYSSLYNLFNIVYQFKNMQQ